MPRKDSLKNFEASQCEPILALVRDLIFASRISAAAQTAGRTVRIVRDAGQLAQLEGPMLILDLNQEGALDAAIAWKHRTGGATVGFVSHVDTATIERARAAGIDEVVARGAFAVRLPQLLAAAKD